MSPELTLLFILLGVLNLGLAFTVMRTPRDRIERALLAGLFGINALVSFIDPFPHSTMYATLDAVTVAFLLAIPAARLAERAPVLARAIFGLAAVTASISIASAFVTFDPLWSQQFPLRAAFLVGLTVFAVESRAMPEAHYFLAAYVMGASRYLPFPGSVTPIESPTSILGVVGLSLMILLGIAFVGALTVAAIGLFRSDRPLTFAPALAAVPVAGMLVYLSYPSLLHLQVRPMLLASGFLLGRLPGGAGAHRVLVLATLAAAAVAAFLAPAVIVTDAGGSLLFAITLGLVGLAAVIGLFARPLASSLLAEPVRMTERVAVEPGALVQGRYQVLRALGSGGSDTAFLADDTRLRRQVVLKIASSAPAVLREARAIAKIDHPNVVRVLDVLEVGDTAILVLEHVEGETLEAWKARGRADPKRVASIAEDVLAALERTHAAGVTHRDVKPANILVGPDGRAHLADFGIASADGIEATGFSWAPPSSAGTPRYMSPEQVRGSDIDARTDLYSLGAVLYELLSGEPVARPAARNGYDLRVAIVQDPPTFPIPDVPPAWESVLVKLLAKEKGDRPASASEARAMLRAGDLL